jgi:hypothetical protein
MARNNAAIFAAYRAVRDLIRHVASFDTTCHYYHPDRWSDNSDFSNCRPAVDLEHVPTKAERCERLVRDARGIRDGLERLTDILSSEEVSRALVLATPHPATIAGHHQGCFVFAAWSVAADRYESLLAFQESRFYSPVLPPVSREDFPSISDDALTPSDLDDYLSGAGWPHKWDVELAYLELQKEAERATGEPVGSFEDALDKSGVKKRRGRWKAVHALLDGEPHWRTWTPEMRQEKAKAWNQLYGATTGWERLTSEKIRLLIKGRRDQEEKAQLSRE